MLRDFALPNKPQVKCTRLPAMRLIAKCADMFPLVSDYTHTFFLLDLLLQLLLKLLLLSRSAHGHAVRLKTPLPLRTARVPMIILPSGGSAAAVLASSGRDTTLPACSYAFTIGKFRRWWYSNPPCSTFGGWRLIPTGLPLFLALAAGFHLNQLIESKAPFQYPRP